MGSCNNRVYFRGKQRLVVGKHETIPPKKSKTVSLTEPTVKIQHYDIDDCSARKYVKRYALFPMKGPAIFTRDQKRKHTLHQCFGAGREVSPHTMLSHKLRATHQ